MNDEIIELVSKIHFKLTDASADYDELLSLVSENEIEEIRNQVQSIRAIATKMYDMFV